MKRVLLATGAALAAAAAVSSTHVAAACDQYSCAPQLVAASPVQVTLDGKAVRITLQGQYLSDVTAVVLSPVTPIAGYTVYNATTILVTLPANVPPGVYSVRVLSPEGGSNPSFAPQFQVFAAPPPPTPTPAPTPTPKPTPVPKPPVPETGTVVPTPAVAAGLDDIVLPPPPSTLTAGPTHGAEGGGPIAAFFGIALGGLVYILWGNPRRLDTSFRSDVLTHLAGRPAQALHLGRVCLYCGRLHFVWSTRRDLWKAGRYCRARCFMAAESMTAHDTGLHDHDEDGERAPGLTGVSRTYG